jgi:hypothetical protein
MPNRRKRSQALSPRVANNSLGGEAAYGLGKEWAAGSFRETRLPGDYTIDVVFLSRHK